VRWAVGVCAWQDHAAGADLCLLGATGSGKSVLAQAFANWLGYDAEVVPLFRDMTSRDLQVLAVHVARVRSLTRRVFVWLWFLWVAPRVCAFASPLSSRPSPVLAAAAGSHDGREGQHRLAAVPRRVRCCVWQAACPGRCAPRAQRHCKPGATRAAPSSPAVWGCPSPSSHAQPQMRRR
jgi:hypothetical protein